MYHVSDAEQLLIIIIPELQATKLLSNSKRWANLGLTPDMTRNPVTRIVANSISTWLVQLCLDRALDEYVSDGIDKLASGEQLEYDAFLCWSSCESLKH